MLDTRKLREYNDNKAMTTIGSGSKITGELVCAGTIHVLGFVEGSIASDDSVVLLETARVKGDIRAGQVIISGHIKGNIQASERLEIMATGKVAGNICSPRISIHEGVFFEGRCSMKEEPVPQKSEAQAKAPTTAVEDKPTEA